MNTIKLVVLSAALAVSAGSAMAQNLADRAEQTRLASEMNKPATPATLKNRDKSEMLPPVSEADRRVEEFIKSTDMMKPSTLNSPATPDRARGAVPLNEADRKVADTMQRTESSRPN